MDTSLRSKRKLPPITDYEKTDATKSSPNCLTRANLAPKNFLYSVFTGQPHGILDEQDVAWYADDENLVVRISVHQTIGAGGYGTAVDVVNDKKKLSRAEPTSFVGVSGGNTRP